MTKSIIAITFLATILLILPIASIPAYAPSTSFTVVPSGVQAHTLGQNCYAAVPLPGGFGRTYGAAFTAAQAQSVNGVPGHLATLNSPAEQAFTLAFPQGWIGYTRDTNFLPAGAPTIPGGPPTGGWGWVTGETPVSEDWAGGEPNNANNNEKYATHNTFGGKWNDIDFNGFGFQVSRMIVEFPGACLKIVDIDIKPGSDPNSINTKSKGVVPVAILGSATFDVTDVDVTTLAFGPSGTASPTHDPAGHLEDVNNDGFIDLVTHYKQKDTGLASGDTSACITGTTTAGIPINGCDSTKVK